MTREVNSLKNERNEEDNSARPRQKVSQKTLNKYLPITPREAN